MERLPHATEIRYILYRFAFGTSSTLRALDDLWAVPASSTLSASRFLSSTKGCAWLPRAAPSIRHLRLAPRTPKVDLFTRWAMDNGTSQDFECCWNKFYPSTV